MKIYTLTGDDGTTSLSGGRRVPKHSAALEAYGSVDELTSWIGLLRGLEECKSEIQQLIFIQDQLMCCAAGLAHDSSNEKSRLILPDDSCFAFLESEIDKMQTMLPQLSSFILPGGNSAASYCHIARCVCRRAERAVSALNETEKTPAIIIKFLNRLSDFLFVLARLISYRTGNEEIKWTLR
jgi:cob(I)alamin adenosyltransferase